MAEYAALRTTLGAFSLLGLDRASRVGGALFGAIGPRMGISRVARRNIERALPHYTPEQIDAVIAGMWNNLGRIVAEYPFLERIGRERVSITNPELLPQAVRDGGAAIFASGHIANWEIMPMRMLQENIFVNPVYRAPNNPYVDALLLKYRSAHGQLRSFGKSRKGLTQCLRAIQKNEAIGMLIDQKMNTGIEAKFFGHPAMTSTAFVELSRKTAVPLIPGRIVRNNGANFTITLYPPLVVEGRETRDVVADMHGYLEEWIKDKPEQWLWIHRRWKEARKKRK